MPDLCTKLLLALVGEEITYIAKQVVFFFFPQLPEATQHKPVVKVIGDLGEGMPERNKKNKTNSKPSNCKNCGLFLVIFLET